MGFLTIIDLLFAALFVYTCINAVLYNSCRQRTVL